VAARPRAGRDLAHSGGQLLEAAADHVVVVGGPGVLSDPGGCSESTDPGRKPGVSGIPGLAPGDPGNPGLAPGVSRLAASARVAQYAWSADYHHVIGRRLEQLATAVREIAPGARTRCY